MTIRFLGTGTSVGVPQIGCGCPVCTSDDPRDKRRRCSIYVVSSSGRAVLVDTPPELRLSCIEYGISKVDALLLTHAHMDHVAGFDDVRRFNTINGGVPLVCRALPETVEQMHKIFPYIGIQKGERGLFRPQVDFESADEGEPFSMCGMEIEALRVEHGFPCCGWLFREAGKRFAYIPDCHVLPPRTVEKIRGADILAINCLREREHPTHLTLERALAYIRDIAPGHAYLTHMCHDLSHVQYQERLPPAVEPAADGLEIAL